MGVVKRKLTAKLRENIRKNYRSLKKSEFTGEALAYLNRVKGAARARAVRTKKIKQERKERPDIELAGEQLAKDSQLYEIIVAGAKSKGQSVAQFVKENRKRLEKYFKENKTFLLKEVGYVFRYIKRAKKITINGKRTGKKKAEMLLELFKNTFVEEANVYPVIIMELAVGFQGNLELNFPVPDDYEGFKKPNDWYKMIDDKYPHIRYIINKK